MPRKADGVGDFEEGGLLYDKVGSKSLSLSLTLTLTLTPSLLCEKVGSKSYRAPEILASCGYRAPPVDVWALGITVFSLVSGFFPLDEAKQSDWRFARMALEQARGVGPCESIYAMYGRQCPLSVELKELIDAMLAIDPARHCYLSTTPSSLACSPSTACTCTRTRTRTRTCTCTRHAHDMHMHMHMHMNMTCDMHMHMHTHMHMHMHMH